MSKLLWTQKQDIGPLPRVLHALTFDSTSQRTILFGGDSLNGEVFRDTWSWDGENWTQIADIGPSARSEHAIAYDSGRQRIVLFGGTVAGGSVRDTWEWSDDAWTQVADTGPSPRSGHAMTFDSARSRVVLFGGAAAGGGAARNDTWEWDGTDWVQTEDSGPSARVSHAMAFDSSRGKVVLFGGFGSGSALGDTWEYDGNTWTHVEDIGPDACFNSAMVFKSGRCGLFGGASAPGGSSPPPTIFGLSWEWDGNHWTARQDIGPGGRVGHSMAYDSARSRVVLFGGTTLPLDDPRASGTVAGDTWEQYELGAAPTGPGGPSGVEMALATFDIQPSLAHPGDTVVFAISLIGPASSPGQTVEAVDAVSGSVIPITIPTGAISGQTDIPLDPGLGSVMPLPMTLEFVATAGGVSLQMQLQIDP